MERTTRRLVVIVIAVAALAAATVGLTGVLSGPTATAQPAVGPETYFLRIDGIPGGSTDAAHRGQIELRAYEWSSDGKAGLEQPATGSSAGGGGTGRAQVNALHVTQLVSQASPLLMAAVASATQFREATLFVRRGGETPTDYLTIKLTDVRVSSYRTSAASGGAPTDEATLTFAEVEYGYTPQNADGSAAPPIVRSWDFTTGTGG